MMMTSNENIKPIPITRPLKLGEGPHWDAEKQLLFFIDMLSSEVHSYDPVTREHHHAKIDDDELVTFILPIANCENHHLIGFGGHCEIITWDGRSSPSHKLPRKHYITVESDFRVRANDAKASPSGVLFVGSMARKLEGGAVPPGLGNLYAVKGKHMKKLLSNIGISNGLAWNKDETEFYWCETLDQKVYKFPYDAANLEIAVDGDLENYVLLDYRKCNLKGRPDGMTVDTDGFLWIASVDGGGEVLKVDPSNGNILLIIPFPNLTKVASVAFGGPSCEDLYITTFAVDGEQDSGCLFKITGLGSRGYPGVPVKL